jgi:protocatechuate 3,4-dioxygenase beta subunit
MRTIAIFVLLLLEAFSSAADNAIGADRPADGARISGRVLDQKGQPINDALVQVQSSAMGQSLWWAFEPQTRTDADGRFSVPAPFRDIRYSIRVTKTGCADATAGLIPEKGDFVSVTLNPAFKTKNIRGRVLDVKNEPVSTKVVLIGEYGLRASTESNEKGEFSLGNISDYIGQTVPLVRAHGQVSRMDNIIRDGDLEISLCAPAHLKGVVRDKVDGKPVPGATITIQPWFASGFSMETTSNKDGTFDIEGIPPGKYVYRAAAPAHFLPAGSWDWGREFVEGPLASGETRSVTIEMQRTATVKGQVVDLEGHLVPGALVCIQSVLMGDYRSEYRYVAADERGRFTINTAHVSFSDGKLWLAAYSSEQGIGMTEVGPLISGQVAEDVVVKLGSAARVRGTLADPQGRPIKDFACVVDYGYPIYETTDEHGQFDFGLVPLHFGARPPPSVTFMPPRPYRLLGLLGGVPEAAQKPDETEPQYYQYKRVKLEPKPGNDVNLAVTLESAQLLELTGTILDSQQRPVSGAKVYLFTGDATDATWLTAVPSFRDTGSRGEYFISATLLNSAVADEHGHFKFLAVREKGEGMPMGGPNTDWKKYCVGVRSADSKRGKLVREVVVPEDKNQLDLTINLPDLALPDRSKDPAAGDFR